MWKVYKIKAKNVCENLSQTIKCKYSVKPMTSVVQFVQKAEF